MEAKRWWIPIARAGLSIKRSKELLLLALFGPRAMSDLSPECAPKRTSADHSKFMGSRPDSGSVSSRAFRSGVVDANGPKRTFSLLGAMPQKRLHWSNIGAGAAMKRRAFIGLLGGAAALSFAASAQQPSGRVYRVGYVSIGSREQTLHFTKAFEEGLRNLGYRAGENARTPSDAPSVPFKLWPFYKAFSTLNTRRPLFARTTRN